MRRAILLTIIIFLFTILGCSEKELSRSRAESLIKDKIKGSQLTVNILNGEFYDYSYGPNNPEYKLNLFLAKKGYINFENTGYATFKSTLQQSIKPFIIQEKPGQVVRDLHFMIATINIGKKSFKEISGIRKEDNSETKSIAEFTYQYDLTPIGKEIPEDILKAFKINTQARGVAFFTKYDDGWRLEEIAND